MDLTRPGQESDECKHIVTAFLLHDSEGTKNGLMRACVSRRCFAFTCLGKYKLLNLQNRSDLVALCLIRVPMYIS